MTSPGPEIPGCVMDVGACCTIPEIPSDIVEYRGHTSSSDIDQESPIDSGEDLSGYEDDYELWQGDFSGNATDSDAESRMSFVTKMRIVLQRVYDLKISRMPLERLFEPEEEIISIEVSEESDYTSPYGTGYTDGEEPLSDEDHFAEPLVEDVVPLVPLIDQVIEPPMDQVILPPMDQVIEPPMDQVIEPPMDQVIVPPMIQVSPLVDRVNLPPRKKVKYVKRYRKRSKPVKRKLVISSDEEN